MYKKHSIRSYLNNFGFILMLICSNTICQANSIENSTETVQDCLKNLMTEIQTVNSLYIPKIEQINEEVFMLNKLLFKENNHKRQIRLLIRQNRLKDSVALILKFKENEINKIRYLIGIQIIKILYEKMLALDHHFTSVNTFSEINKMSNLNNYPEFKIARNLFLEQNKKKGFRLTDILGENLYTSVVHSLISLFNNDEISQKNKTIELEKIECILDFTLRMNNDLNIIYFETVFLQKSNEDIIESLEVLFESYTKPISYDATLSVCREKDDWETVVTHLTSYFNEIQSLLSLQANEMQVNSMHVDIKFPIDRLILFINQYNMFIIQSAKFYEKFATMLTNYENETICTDQLPIEYYSLKQKITITSEKFLTAYKPVDINGSKLKQLLYGISEYN